MDKLWAICGLPVEQVDPSRMVVCAPFHMHRIKTPEPLFYRKPRIDPENVSERTLSCVQKCTINI